jgi:hypothetical protein
MGAAGHFFYILLTKRVLISQLLEKDRDYPRGLEID